MVRVKDYNWLQGNKKKIRIRFTRAVNMGQV